MSGKTKLSPVIGAVALAAAFVMAGCQQHPEGATQTAKQPLRVREPAVAGLFYPKDPQQLSQAIDALLAAAKPDAAERIADELVSLAAARR